MDTQNSMMIVVVDLVAKDLETAHGNDPSNERQKQSNCLETPVNLKPQSIVIAFEEFCKHDSAWQQKAPANQHESAMDNMFLITATGGNA